MTEPTIIKVLHYTSQQLKLLNRNASLFIDSPPEHTKKYLESLLKSCNGDISKVLGNLLARSGNHMQTFSEFPYETVSGGEVKVVQVLTYIYVFKDDMIWDE